MPRHRVGLRYRAGFFPHPGMPGYLVRTIIEAGCAFKPVDCIVYFSEHDFYIRLCVIQKYSKAIDVLRYIAERIRSRLCDIRLCQENGKRIAMKAYVYDNDDDLIDGVVKLSLVEEHHEFSEPDLPENYVLSSSTENCKQESDNGDDWEDDEDSYENDDSEEEEDEEFSELEVNQEESDSYENDDSEEEEDEEFSELEVNQEESDGGDDWQEQEDDTEEDDSDGQDEEDGCYGNWNGDSDENDD